MSTSDPKFIGKTKEKYFFHNTLLCLVKALQGKHITVDLRNDAYICGLLIVVDGYMNLSFSNAVYCDTRGEEYSFENLFVQARNIRYVHVPEMMPIIESIKNELIMQRHKPTQKPLKVSRKVKKAQKKHLETVAALDISQ